MNLDKNSYGKCSTVCGLNCRIFVLECLIQNILSSDSSGEQELIMILNIDKQEIN